MMDTPTYEQLHAMCAELRETLQRVRAEHQLALEAIDRANATDRVELARLRAIAAAVGEVKGVTINPPRKIVVFRFAIDLDALKLARAPEEVFARAMADTMHYVREELQRLRESRTAAAQQQADVFASFLKPFEAARPTEPR